MAVTVRAPFPAGTAGTIVAASTTITTSVTLLTGDDLELHCAYDKASDTGVTLSAKLDPTGANLSPDGSSTIVHANGSTVGFEQVFWWLNASLSGAGLLGAGAKNVTVTASTSADSMEQKAYALTGADHNAPTVTTAVGSSASAAVTSASCPSNGLAIGHFVGGSSYTATNNTNTLLQSGTSGNAGWNIAGNTATGAGSTISLTGTLPADFWAAIATVWAPAGAGPTPGPPATPQKWPTRLVGRWPLPQTLPTPPKVITPPPYFKDWSTNTTPDLIVSAEDWGLLPNAGLNHAGDFAATYEDYFTTRQAQGYNGVEVSIFSYGTLSGGANGADSDGTFPFSTNTDPSTTPNTTFWGRRDTFLTKAAAHGFRVFMNVTTPNIHNTPTSFTLGWTSTQWSNFGTFLGTRYASQSNIMWIVGDDYFDDIDSNLTTFLSALRAAGATQPISIQNYQEASSRRDISTNSVRPWGNTNAQYNWGYSYNFWYDVVEKMGLEASPLPYMAADGFFLASGATGLTDVQLMRRMIWWALSSGSKGFQVGDNDVWTWSSTALGQLTSKTFYTTVIPAIASYFRSLPNWHLLVADTSNVLVTSGRGTHGAAITSGGGGTPYTSNSDSYVTASRAVDGSLAVIYMSHASSITIDESQMVAGYQAYWVDPVTGSATLTTSGSSYSSSGLGNNSDGQADWVLVLRQAGTGVTGTAAATQANQTASASGQLGYSGTSAVTQAANTSAASGTVINPVTGTSAVTQANQTSSATGQLGYVGSAVDTQAPQTSAATGQLGYSGTSATTQANQTSTASGQLGYSGTSTATQANQTSSASGTFTGSGFSGNAANTQAPNTSSASGQLGYSGTASQTQANQASAAAGQLGYTGTAADSQAAQTSAANGTYTSAGSFTGTAANAQANETSAASGQLGYSGTATPSQANQASTASGAVVNPIAGTAANTQANQASAASGVLRYSGTSGVTQAPNISAGVGVVSGPVAGSAAVIQANQISTAVGTFMPLVSYGTASGSTSPVPTANAASMNVPKATGG